MDNNNPISLKASMFGGYKKKDVLSYIFELNESSQESQQKFAEQIEELSQSREALVNELAEAQTKLESLQSGLDDAMVKLEDEVQKSAEAQELAEKYKREADAHFKNAVQKESDIQRVSAINAELAEKNRRLEEKREEVELAASQIAGLLGKAQSDSGKLIEDAEAEAERIISAAHREAEGIVKKAEESASRRIKDANSAFDRAYAQFEDFCSELEVMKAEVANTALEMNNKIEALGAVAAKTRDAMPRFSVDTAVSLSYSREDALDEGILGSGESYGGAGLAADEPSAYANDVLSKYGVRRDDSGFFRLAAEQ